MCAGMHAGERPAHCGRMDANDEYGETTGRRYRGMSRGIEVRKPAQAQRTPTQTASARNAYAHRARVHIAAQQHRAECGLRAGRERAGRAEELHVCECLYQRTAPARTAQLRTARARTWQMCNFARRKQSNTIAVFAQGGIAQGTWAQDVGVQSRDGLGVGKLGVCECADGGVVRS